MPPSRTQRPIIGVDLHTLEGLHQGSRTHCIELFSRVVRLMPEVDFALFVDTSRWNAAAAERFVFPNAVVVDMPHVNSIRRLLFQLPALARRCKVDLLHTQYISPPSLGRRNVITIHDILFEDYPQYFTPFFRLRSKTLFRTSAAGARHVFTVSDYSRQELIARYRVPPAKVTTLHNAANTVRFFPGPEGAEAVRAEGLVPGEYLLAVGRLEPRKNYATLLKAYAGLPAPRPKLAIVGQRDFGYAEVIALQTSLGLEQEVVFLEKVDDALLPALYRHCRAFVYATFAEGFGMPVIEAMASGVPVITSNTTSLPEIAGDATLLIDPADPEGLRSAMHRLLRDPALAARLAASGLERSKLFSWDTSAQTLATCYREMLGLAS